MAETTATLYSLDRQSLDALEIKTPQIAMAVQQFVIRELSGRIDAANRQLAAMQ